MNERFIYIENSNSIFKKIDNKDLKTTIINPITKKPYDGIVIEGIAACFKNVPNNNNRLYDKANYLDYVKLLRKNIFSKKGVYGELEHPKRYQVDYNYISHKLIDIWYDEITECVMLRILILNNKFGNQIKSVYESGGAVSVSARAAGEEVAQPDGTKKAVVRLLVTYDVVCNPGFGDSVMDFVNLNESISGHRNISKGIIIPENKISKLGRLFESEKQINKSINFNNWLLSKYFTNNLFESEEDNDQQHEVDENKMQNSDIPGQQQAQNQLQDAVDDELNESNKTKLLFESNIKLRKLYRQNKLADKTIFDNSAGFIETDM